jgi:murein DD-endopeptidase MepM/ murein hydrolase activator NlpD
MLRSTASAFLMLLVLLAPVAVSRDSIATPATGPREPFTTIQGTIERRATLVSALAGHIPVTHVAQLVAAARPLYDLARISVGRPFAITLGRDGFFRAFSYGIDELRTLRVVRKGEGLRAEIVEREYETKTVVVSGVIESSLFAAIEAAGEGDQLALDLADVFAWDIDFNTEIQSGDSFRAAVEKLSLDGSPVRYGRILAAEFVRGGRVLRAFRHEGTAGAHYYDADGRPLRKAFLRSPLRFTRISSRFARSRRHPILRTWRPHLGVDYAAPSGTAVHAAADGVVVLAGWLGGYGRTVRIRHANGYETLYGHLARIDVTRGRRVTQGMRIGAVGATGLATGPHLDYRMGRNGQFVDPLRVASPPAAPIPGAERDAFLSSARRFTDLLAGAATAGGVAASAPTPTRSLAASSKPAAALGGK